MLLKLLLSLTVVSSAVCRLDSDSAESDESSEEVISGIRTKSMVSRPRGAVMGQGEKSGSVVEKFVETLISSEKYLKQVESIEKKLNHVDSTIHERTNIIIKYLNEILRASKVSSTPAIEESLRNLKSNLDRFKETLLDKVHRAPTMRAEGNEVTADSNLEGRLVEMENQMKSISSGVESIVGVIQEVKNRPPPKPAMSSDLTIINEFRKTLSEHRQRKCDCSNRMRTDRSERYPTDCHEIQMQGFNISGIYKIQPEDMEPFYVLCDLTTAGGGWTVLQNRFDGTQDFYKGWADYKHGFGNLAGEYWLGLEKLHYLTNQKLYELRVTMETQVGQEAFAAYSVFTIGPEHEGYRISTLGTFYGTAGDSLSYHAGQKFSTPDVDNDEWKKGACAVEHGGSWWYKECDKSNLNGQYMMATKETGGQSIYWISFKEPTIPLAKTKMMIRPLPASRPTDQLDLSRKSLAHKKPVPESIQRKAKHRKSYKFVGTEKSNPFIFK